MNSPSPARSRPVTNLGHLFPEITEPALSTMSIAGLTLDSRTVVAGELFLACRGEAHDGRDYVEQAVSRGAGAIALDAVRGEEDQVAAAYARTDVPIFVVPDLGKRLSAVAGNFYDDPSRHITLTGVTGTNGKTTCSQLLGQLYRRMYGSGGVIGTLGASSTGTVKAAINTTPDAVRVQGLLSEWYHRGVNFVAMEVSSHALEQGRVAALDFDCAVFTNLTRDHLDYHGSMAAYGASKATLFRQPGLRRAVLNADDPFSEVLRGEVGAEVECLTYSSRDRAADISASNAVFHDHGLSARVHSPWGEGDMQLPLLGEFNLSNALAALASLCAGGASLEEVLSTLRVCSPIPGRMQPLHSVGAPQVIIDYAHTPDALKQVLTAARHHTPGQLWCVFGCGGDRDRGKRPEMGAAACAGADVVLVTSDNPRTEEPLAIIDDVLRGCSGDIRVESDRGLAIALAVAEAAAGDTVVIAGKGHEDYQEIGVSRIPFSDVQHAQLALQGGSVQ